MFLINSEPEKSVSDLDCHSKDSTCLVLAGTDIFYPPIGSWITNWIASPGLDPAALVPYAKEMYDPSAYDAMRAFRKPFITFIIMASTLYSV